MTAPQIIEFYFEAVSPYSYWALIVLKRYISEQIWNNIEIQLKPCQAGIIAISAKNKTPGMVPIKGRYVVRDMKRLFTQYNIPFNMYSGKDHVTIMQNSIQSTRFLTAVSILHSEQLFDISLALSSRWWSQGLNFNDEIAFRAVSTAAGLSEQQITALLHEMNSDRVKQSIDTNNNTMIQLGGFGVPTILVHTANKTKTSQIHPVSNQHVELLFGSDRLQQVAYMINQKWIDYMPTQSSKL
jgi:2-hydroxychromene-2-carboxylate isomerase